MREQVAELRRACGRLGHTVLDRLGLQVKPRHGQFVWIMCEGEHGAHLRISGGGMATVQVTLTQWGTLRLSYDPETQRWQRSD